MRRTSLMLGFAAIVASQAFLGTPSALAVDVSLKNPDSAPTAAQERVGSPNAARGGTQLLSESFTDATFPPAGWAVFNVDGQPEQWARFTGSFNTTPASAMHVWNPSIAQEGWLVTPPLSITSGATASLSFVDGGQWMDDYGYSGVMVSDASCVPGDGEFVELAEIDDSPGPGGTVTWRAAAVELDLSAYAGDTICVAFLYEGTNAHRWLIDDVVITEIGGGGTDPEIDVSPASFSFNVDAGDTDSDTLTIDNIGGGTLIWDIELEDTTTDVRGGFDPLLNEELDFANFQIISPANGGTPEVQIVQAGVLTSGLVVGFSFEGTVAGVTGNGDWASDMCMQIEGPDGSSYTVGGISASVANCNINNWDFQGGGSTNDGTYTSSHPAVWPDAQDAGDWTFTFIHGWDSTSANPMNWSDVTVTLHKVGIPEPCDNPGLVSWLSVDPAAGSTNAGSPSLVDVQVDSDGLTPGTYNANLCVNSDDTVGNELVVVPVELTVAAGDQPEITVDPTSLSGTAEEGDFTTAMLNIGNIGAAELVWSIEEAPGAASPRAHFPSTPRFVQPAANRHLATAQAAVPSQGLLDKLALEVVGPDPTQRRMHTPLRGTGVPAYSIAAFTFDSLVSFDVLAPGTLTPISTPRPQIIFGKTFIDYDFSQAFFIASTPPVPPGTALPVNTYGYIDTATGAVTQLGTITGGPAGAVNWGSLSWDPSTGEVYALRNPELYRIDPNTGVATLVGVISGAGINPAPIFVTIAFSPDGLLYGLDIADDVLVAIDKTNAQATVIGPVGIDANFAQDMEFDHSTGILYWAGFSGTTADNALSRMFTIDTVTGAATLIGPIDNRAELVTLSIAQAGSFGNCSDPADVPWLSVDPDAGSILPGGPDDEVEVTLDADGLSAGVYTASLCVLSNDPGNPVVQVPVEFTVSGDPVLQSDLALSLFGSPGTVNAGDDLNLYANVVNFGPDPASDVSVEIELPVEFTFVSGRMIEGTGDWTCAAVATTVTCDMTGALAIGFAELLQIEVSVDAGADSGTVDTMGEVTSSNDDPNPANNVDSVTTTIIGAPADLIFANGFECAPGYPDCVGDPGTEFTEGFEDVASLFTGGNPWIRVNRSEPLGPFTWSQNGAQLGDPGQQGGSPLSSIINNFESTTPTGVGVISDWLLTPEVTFSASSTFSFYTRAFNTVAFPDRLELRVCSGSPCTDVGGDETSVGEFTTLLVSVNPNLVGADDPTGQNGYPQSAFAQFTVTAADGLPTSGQGRIAFRYFVTNAGGNGANSSTIGVDTVVMQDAL